MTPRDIAARLCVQIAIGVAVLLAGMWVGYDLAETRASAAREKALAAAQKRYQEAVDDGAERVARLAEQQRLQNSHYATLDERQRHAVSLIAPVHGARTCSASLHAAAGSPGSAAGSIGPHAGTGDRADASRGLRVGLADAGAAEVAGAAGALAAVEGGLQAHALADAADSLSLSLAAVSLWNSALAAADVSAGACRADALAEPACAAGAGITLDDAWRNQRANAASCAADRARHQALIDFINRRAQQ